MIILNASNKNVSLISNRLNDISVKSGWTDNETDVHFTSATTEVSATEKTIVPAPAGAGVTRAVKTLEFRNNSLVAGAMLTINKNVAGVPTLIYKTELFPGHVLKFSSRRGWYKIDNDGVILELTDEPDYMTLIDETSTPDVVYSLRALPGSDLSEPVWASAKISLTTNIKTWAGGTNQMRHIANNRVALTYS